MPKDKDPWDKVGIVFGIIGDILVPLAIFYAGYFISQAQTQAQNLTSLIEHLSSSNQKQQLMAVKVANYLQENNQLPAGILSALMTVASETKDSETSLLATKVVLAAAKSSNAAEQTVKKEFSDIAPRVYFHIPREELRDYARTKEKALEDKLAGIIVPGIDLKPKASPAETQLRYFKSDENGEALSIQSALKEIGVDAKLIDLSPSYENSKDIRPRHYELWIGRNTLIKKE